MELQKAIFDLMPRLVESEGNTLRINFDVETCKIQSGSNTASDDEDNAEGDSNARSAFKAYVVRIPQPIERDKMVNAIVSEAYPQDKMQAIINNHFINLATLADGKKLDSDEQQHEDEYNEMQDWRKHAKEVATKAMEYFAKNM